MFKVINTDLWNLGIITWGLFGTVEAGQHQSGSLTSRRALRPDIAPLVITSWSFDGDENPWDKGKRKWAVSWESHGCFRERWLTSSGSIHQRSAQNAYLMRLRTSFKAWDARLLDERINARVKSTALTNLSMDAMISEFIITCQSIEKFIGAMALQGQFRGQRAAWKSWSPQFSLLTSLADSDMVQTTSISRY